MEYTSLYEIIIAGLAGELTAQEQEELQDWLEQSPANREKYEKIKELYFSLHPPSMPAQTYDTQAAWKCVETRMEKRKRIFFTPVFYRYAAVLLVLFTLGISFYRFSQPTPSPDITDVEQPTLLLQGGKQIPLKENTFSMNKDNVRIKNDGKNTLVYESEEATHKTAAKIGTNHLLIPKRTTYNVELSDGTKVWLNSGSELIYPTRFAGDERVVTLIGEAYFEVAHQAERPFRVHSNGLTVEVLGTSFNMDAYPGSDQIVTTLVEGSVRITTEENKPVLLAPSEQLIYDRHTLTTEVREVDTSLYTSWKQDLYIFRNATLQEVITRLQHWHDFTVVYQNESLKYKRYTFTAGRQTAIEQLLEVINFTSDVKLERTDDMIYVKQKRKEE